MGAVTRRRENYGEWTQKIIIPRVVTIVLGAIMEDAQALSGKGEDIEESNHLTLAVVAQWIECWPAN